MMRKNNLFSLLLLLAMFTATGISCKKNNGPRIVEGKVQNSTTSEGIAGATVYLMQRNPDCFSCQGTKIANTTADSEGNFHFEFTPEEGFRYSIGAEASKYFNNYYKGGESFDHYEKESLMTVGLDPEAWLKIHIKNTQPVDGTDHIGINLFLGGGVGYYGTHVDTFLIQKVYGSRSITVPWFVTKNNVTNNYSSQVYSSQFDTTLYTITY